jgi:hypothetical protein
MSLCRIPGSEFRRSEETSMHPITLGFFGIGTSLGGLIGLIALVFWVAMLIDAFRRQFDSQTTNIVWLLVIFFLNTIGALLYYFIGRNQGRLIA